MIQIDDAIVSPDMLREKSIYNLDACKGKYCVKGDVRASVELEEVERLEEVLPVIWDKLSPKVHVVIDKREMVHADPGDDLVTSIVDGKDCVFTCYDEKGYRYRAIEETYREGKVNFYKPVFCYPYPIRVDNYRPYKAVNYHRWDVCKTAILLNRKENVSVYRFLKKLLICKFDRGWYNELEIVVKELRDRGMI